MAVSKVFKSSLLLVVATLLLATTTHSLPAAVTAPLAPEPTYCPMCFPTAPCDPPCPSGFECKPRCGDCEKRYCTPKVVIAP
ncbi:MAG: hypothetical protein J3Q66DRAFT_324381 [Benniella sp.]|nr:MAG: hypothetical protein J3Q66DRAFT_324381 [Benniella sp.]